MNHDLSREKKNGNWKLCFSVACWILWLRRSKQTFDDDQYQVNVILEIYSRVHEYTNGNKILYNAGISSTQSSVGSKWTAPDFGWLKLIPIVHAFVGGHVINYGVFRDW